jgi:hypothetical protein
MWSKMPSDDPSGDDGNGVAGPETASTNGKPAEPVKTAKGAKNRSAAKTETKQKTKATTAKPSTRPSPAGSSGKKPPQQTTLDLGLPAADVARAGASRQRTTKSGKGGSSKRNPGGDKDKPAPGLSPGRATNRNTPDTMAADKDEVEQAEVEKSSAKRPAQTVASSQEMAASKAALEATSGEGLTRESTAPENTESKTRQAPASKSPKKKSASRKANRAMGSPTVEVELSEKNSPTAKASSLDVAPASSTTEQSPVGIADQVDSPVESASKKRATNTSPQWPEPAQPKSPQLESLEPKKVVDGNVDEAVQAPDSPAASSTPDPVPDNESDQKTPASKTPTSKLPVKKTSTKTTQSTKTPVGKAKTKRGTKRSRTQQKLQKLRTVATVKKPSSSKKK